MKKLLFLLFLISSLLAPAQNGEALKNITTIKFYGVDYSQVKVYGAAESPAQFKSAFDEINELFLTQPKKFDVGKFVGKNVEKISLNAVNTVNGEVNLHDLITTNNEYTLNDLQINQAIQNLPVSIEPGVGMILIAKLLNKANNNGTYQIVFFRVENREIIESNPINGKAGGFGLRNFWAGSVYKALKKIY